MQCLNLIYLNLYAWPVNRKYKCYLETYSCWLWPVLYPTYIQFYPLSHFFLFFYFYLCLSCFFDENDEGKNIHTRTTFVKQLNYSELVLFCHQQIPLDCWAGVRA